VLAQEGHFLLVPAMAERQNRRAQELLEQDCVDMASLALHLPQFCINFNSPGAGNRTLALPCGVAVRGRAGKYGKQAKAGG
jgi:hypothetical protein